MKTSTIVAVLIVLLAAAGAWYYFMMPKGPMQGGSQACTLEAKLCPDGSHVGRTGPNCSFAPCSSTTGTTQPGVPVTSSTSVQVGGSAQNDNGIGDGSVKPQ